MLKGWNAAGCTWQLEKQHLEEAKTRGAMVMMTGDFFDAMQGRFDPRRSMDGLRPEYRVQNYFDGMPEDAARWRMNGLTENGFYCILMLTRG